jgi:hydroxyquinol 1,2-dioxygenase
MTAVEEELTRRALASHEGCTDTRLKTLMDSLLRHLHAFVREVELTPDEWMAAIRFLTDTGHKCGESRQEFILLSDVLGISMLVDAIANRNPNGATESAVLGPFYAEGAPEKPLGCDLSRLPGARVTVSGRVRSTNGEPIFNAQLDIWQTASNGLYHMQDENQARFNLCAKLHTDSQGRYAFQTLKPVSYPIPTDGPVGALLGRLGRNAWRPAHIHFIVTADGHKPVVTQLFTRGDPHLGEDPVLAVKSSLVVDCVPEGHDVAGERLYRVDYDFVLQPVPAAARMD